jgi:xanthine dehydrogenase molybdopterin-binding subunit B
VSSHVPRTDRREDGPLLFGRGTFIDGLRLPELDGALHAVFVRSIEPHGRLESIDVTEASAMPGVVAVLTGSDLTDVWVLPPRLPMMNQAMVRPMMAHTVVRFVGEPVAVVLAESRAQAVDAAETVIVETEALPPVIDLDEALRGDRWSTRTPVPTCRSNGRCRPSKPIRSPSAMWSTSSRFAIHGCTPARWSLAPRQPPGVRTGAAPSGCARSGLRAPST